jgi:hypothetical protein
LSNPKPAWLLGLKRELPESRRRVVCALCISLEEYSPRLIMCTLHTPRGVLQVLEKYSSRLMCEASLPDSLSSNRQSKREKPHNKVDGGEAIRELEALEDRSSKARRRPKEKEK